MSYLIADKAGKSNLLAKHLFVLPTAILMFVLPLDAHCQDEAPDTLAFAEPVQLDFKPVEIKKHEPDIEMAKKYCEMATASDNIDTIMKYAALSLEYCKPTDSALLSSDYYELGYAYYIKDDARDALDYTFKAMHVYDDSTKNKYVAQACLGVGLCYEDLNVPDSIFLYFNKALNIYITLQDTSGICQSYKDIGDVYTNMKMFANAEEAYRKALHYSTLLNDTLDMATHYRCIGQLLAKKSDTLINSAIENLRRSIYLFESKETDNENYITIKHWTYTDLARTYIKVANQTGNRAYADSCYMYIRKVGNYNLKVGDPFSYLLDRYTYTDYLVFFHRYNEALDNLLKLEKFFDDDSPAADRKTYHRRLYEVYLHLEDYKNALAHYKKYDEYKSEQVNENTLNSIKNAEVERTRMIEALKLENEEKLHAAERRRMRIVNISLISGLGLVLLLIFYITRVLHIKHKANAELAKKNALLAEKNAILAEQAEEIQAQNDEILKQNEEIQAQAKTIKEQSEEIHDSINYARRIQRSLLTPSKNIASIFPDYFILYKPRNVVSGDYYWVGQFGDNKVSIVADCTGHGVPGGFMSVLGMANLNYIVAQEISPDKILNHLREAIIINLRQHSHVHTALHDADHVTSNADLNDRSRDGMDVAAYVVNERLMKLSYAGANNPLVLIRGGEVQVLKADRMPVGIHECLDPFQCTTIDIQKGDCIYTFSDGFQDQFGVESGKKFMSRRLRELLLEIHQQPMAEQKKMLNLVYEEWRGPAENQTDDVVIMGVRI
ncbi:MAG: SpoIIE family protein phosphatase [Paludibacteraceae bacterium]|nr:SpoIIE family protein phosphatase [Paludibacteraceae bacterium]